jgi:hypothetical protein
LRRSLNYPLYDYSIFGLQVKTNQPLPTLLKNSKKNSAPDIEVWLDAIPVWVEKKLDHSKELFYKSDYLDCKGDPALKIWKLRKGSYFWLCYNDGTKFLVNREGSKIWGIRSDDTTLEDTMIYLVGPVLGFVLRLRGIPCLHASAVAIDGQAVAFLGSAEAGKSTTAAVFAVQGYPVITEDIVTLCCQDQKFLVQPGYSFISLWPDTVKMLYGISDALPRLTPASGINALWDKRYLDLQKNGYTFQEKPLPLKAIYILSGYSDDRETPFIEAPISKEIFISLIANSYMTYLLDNHMRMEEFKSLARVVNRIPLRKVTPPMDPTYLPKLCKAILDDFRALRPLT